MSSESYNGITTCCRLIAAQPSSVLQRALEQSALLGHEAHTTHMGGFEKRVSRERGKSFIRSPTGAIENSGGSTAPAAVPQTDRLPQTRLQSAAGARN